MAATKRRAPKHLMIDLETLGTSPTAVIASIAAVWFHPEKADEKDCVLDTFHVHIELESYKEFGSAFTMDAATLKFWFQQSSELQQKTLVNQNAVPLRTALEQFLKFAGEHMTQFTKVWCQGTDFDMPILRNAVKAVDEEVPWNFWQAADSRTLFFVTKVGNPPKGEDHHDALADAVSQATWVWQAYRKLKTVRAS